MIDDLAEGVVRGVLGTVLRVVFEVIVEVIFFYTGEMVLFIVTLGRKRPRWDAYGSEHLTKFWVLTDLSVLVGFAFWLTVAGLAVAWVNR
jgi:hypothetical protein